MKVTPEAFKIVISAATRSELIMICEELFGENRKLREGVEMAKTSIAEMKSELGIDL
jgi:hypothetical protein